MRHRLLPFALVLAAGLTAGATAQDEEKKQPPMNPPRYGFDYSPQLYPQGSPKDAMKSIVRAIDARRLDYMLAQLADPKFIDGQIAEYRKQIQNQKKGNEEAQTFFAFDRLVRETAEYYLNDPILVKELRRFAKHAAWEENEDLATGTVKEVPARKVFLRRIGDRWFLENRQQ